MDTRAQLLVTPWEKTMRTGGRRIYVTVGTLGGGGKITLIAESTATR